jgi:hypothetical protein
VVGGIYRARPIVAVGGGSGVVRGTSWYGWGMGTSTIGSVAPRPIGPSLMVHLI